MIKTKNQMFIVIGVFLLVIVLGSVTYAFFNYTREGTANTIGTGRITFNSEQGQAINLTNVFPIDVTNGIPNNSNVGSVTINVSGDTTYGEGIEYLVSAVNVENTIGSGANAKSLPISIDVSVTSNTGNNPATTLGTSDEEYYSNRGSSASTSIYKVLVNDVIANNDQLLVGYIKSGATRVDGNIIIKAYIDKSKVAISDTYPGEETDSNNDGYIDGTTSNWVDDRVLFSITEWNSLISNGVSFQIKVEANDGIWVDESVSVPTMAEMCPGCVFFFPDEDEDMYTTWNTENETPTVISNYSNDYQDVFDENKKIFFGAVLNNDYAERVFVCSIYNGNPFCLEPGAANFSNNLSILRSLEVNIYQNDVYNDDYYFDISGVDYSSSIKTVGLVEIGVPPVGIGVTDERGRFGFYTS